MSESDTSTLTQDTAAATTSPAGQPTTATPSWRDTLPDDLKASPVLAKYQDQNAAMKALVEAQALIGKKAEGLKVPGPDAKPEEVAEFYKALGRPEAPDKYTMPKVEGIPEGFGISPEVEKVAREALHGLGLSQKQFEGAMAALVGDSLKQMQAKEAFRVSELKAFESEHGEKAKGRLELALKAARVLGGDAFLKALNETGAGNHRVVYEALAKFGETLGEAALKLGEPAGGKNFNDLPPTERITAAREAGYK